MLPCHFHISRNMQTEKGKMMQEANAAVKFEHISMVFPGVLANDDISMEIRKGEVFAIVGENGAGKSTLMNILYGIHEPTDGDVYLYGKKVEHFNPKSAIAMGVGMVHQHFMLVPSFTVAQNIVMSREPKKFGLFFDNKKAEELTRSLEEEYGLTVDPSAKVGEIGVGLQQRVEILKALYRGADILILDEPTAVLTPQETDELFAVIRKIVKEKQMTVIIITHKLYEVLAISDRVAVMRKGKLEGIRNTCEVDQRQLSSMMVGRPVLFEELTRTGTPGNVQMEVKNLSVNDNRGLTAVKDMSFAVRSGEILGIAAIEGNGQSELIEVLTGMRQPESGSVSICGTSIVGKTPDKIREAGLACVPEDRMTTGVCGDASVTENLLVGKHREARFNQFGFHQKKDEIETYAKTMYEQYDIRGYGIDGQVKSMSGGNMQKVVIAREFSFETPAMVISQPSRGVDVGAMEFIHSCIIEKRNNGCAILLSSADLDELFRLSDRIITIYEGKITGEFRADAITKEEIGYYMTGDRTGKEAQS